MLNHEIDRAGSGVEPRPESGQDLETATDSRRVLFENDPYRSLDAGRRWSLRGTWPCQWVRMPEVPDAPFLAAYSLSFTLDAAAELTVHISADERYLFYCDGARVGCGPERGDPSNWFFESYQLNLEPGKHCFVAKVWSLGKQAPYAQMSVGHGFLLGAEGAFGALLDTGRANWQAKLVQGCTFTPAGLTWGGGAHIEIDGTQFPWQIESGTGADWADVVAMHPGANGAIRNEWPPLHRLYPATLPAQLHTPATGVRARYADGVASTATKHTPVREASSDAGLVSAWQGLLDDGTPLRMPARTACRIILDFQNYMCAYSELRVSGGAGARIRIHWAEGLFEGIEGEISGGGAADARGKGDRSVIDQKCFIGEGDVFLPDGGVERRFEPLWWSAGRYVEVTVETAEAPLVIEGLRFNETRYPMEWEGRLQSGDPRWDVVARLSLRTLQACAHETYMDCPYYEQLQYFGDTRLQILTGFTVTRDVRLPRKALRMAFASILREQGQAQSRYPSRVAQVIPPNSLWCVSMLHDFALWRGEPAFVRSLMSGARELLESFLNLLTSEGLMRSPEGWNLVDWVPEWTATTGDFRNWGIPPDGESGISGVLNWQFVYALRRAAELEAWLGEEELSVRWLRHANALAERLDAAFWVSGRNLYADDRGHRHFSEHAQCLALLSGALDAERTREVADALFQDAGLARATIYCSHYLFECAASVGNLQPLLDRMESLWFPLQKMGFVALPEEPEPCRSDCHAWGAHPLYHYYATLLGIRPDGLGGEQLLIRPRPGANQQASGVLPHFLGDVVVEVEDDGQRTRGRVELPAGLRARLQVNGAEHVLEAGVFEW